MTGFLNFILWFFLILYLLKFLGRLLAPILLRYFANKMQNRFQQNFKQHFNTNSTKQEGDVTIEKQKNKPSKKNKDVEAEYVDFEEIED